jgi:hypothetical protein
MVSLSELAPTFGLLAGVVAVACNVPYLRDTWRGSTVPHRGSWLIWSVLEVVAVGAQGAGGARWSLLPLVVQAAGTCLVLALAVRRGQGGLSRVDLGLLGLATLGLAGWMAVDEPVIATACVVVADLLAALMMVPKAWREPHSETLSTFVLASASGALTALAVGTFAVSLLAYPVYFVAVNAGLASVILGGRRVHRRAARAAKATPVRSEVLPRFAVPPARRDSVDRQPVSG